MTGPGRRRPREGLQPLHRDAIVDVALRIVGAEGLDALNMRRVAEELDTGPASLYAHVSSKEELLDLALDRVVGEMAQPGTPDPARWQEQLKDVLRATRTALAAHGDLAGAQLARIPTGENSLRVSEGVLAILRAGGVPDQAAAYAVDILFLYVTATAYEDGLNVLSGEKEAEVVSEIQTFFAQLPAEQFPNVTRLVPELTRNVGDERFEFGVDLMVRGLASLVPPA